MTGLLNAELHCHNLFSNYQNSSVRIPFDCGIMIEDQLNAALQKGIEVLFVTNHNTLDGYAQILDYKNHHAKFDSIKIYPAEEITIDNQGHVLAYGLHHRIKPGMTLEETLDEIKSQNAISCAAHPFAVTNGIREKAALCDMMESFNSNNVDRFSNVIAERFAKEHNMKSIAGSDSHVLSTMGKCVNSIESENNLDSVLHAMQKGKVEAASKEYASKEQLFEHAFYIISSSKDLLLEYALVHHPRAYSTARWALNSFTSNPNSKTWRLLASFTLYLTKRASEKVNIKGYDPQIFSERPWKRLIALSLKP
ncbi:MAG TPA: PHP-associated domain-containing protein [Nitrososphaera sp.]|nr:PHP-associated domain-containing protein [Nitrososphaera sp.]